MAHDRMVGRTEGSVHLIAATCENIPANLLTISSLPKIMAMTGPYRHADTRLDPHSVTSMGCINNRLQGLNNHRWVQRG